MSKAQKSRPHKVKGHQLYMARPSVWAQLKKENKIDKIYQGKAFYIGYISFITRPFQWLQRIIYGKRIKNVDFTDKEPVFILGHWRSGTTHLHYIMHKDPQFGVLSNYQNFTFNIALLSKTWLKNLLAPLMPEKRPQDNVRVDADKPAEEEQPLSTITTASGIHSWNFPKNHAHYFDKFNLFKNITPEEKKAWQDGYMECVRNISVYNDNKRLVLKNPHNTSRVKELLELFPNAKFIFIHRNPFDVFLSTRHLYYRVVRTQFLQFVSHKEIDDMIFHAFRSTMKKYLAERHLIPKGNLVEIGFDELEADGYKQVDRIYNELSLPNYDKAFPHIDEYLKSVKNYKKNKFRNISPEVEARIIDEFDFAFEEWGYEKKSN